MAPKLKLVEIPIPEPLPSQSKVTVRIQGLPPGLLQHRFSEKKRHQMLEKQLKTKVGAKEARDPVGDYEAAAYLIREPNGTKYGHPAAAFKASICAAGHRCTEAFKRQTPMLRSAMMIDGVLPMDKSAGMLVPIFGEPEMDERPVRNATGVADLRFRPLFEEWTADLRIAFNPDLVSIVQLRNLIALAGDGIGIGEGRPDKCTMDYGRWEFVTMYDGWA